MPAPGAVTAPQFRVTDPPDPADTDLNSGLERLETLAEARPAPVVVKYPSADPAVSIVTATATMQPAILGRERALTRAPSLRT